MHYLYTLSPSRVLHAARYDSGERVSHASKGVVEDIARIWSVKDGKTYTIDQRSDLDNTRDGVPLDLPNQGVHHG